MGINGGARLDVLEAAPSACPGRAISYKPYVIRRVPAAYNIELCGGGRHLVAEAKNCAATRHVSAASGGVPGAGDGTRRNRGAGRPRWAAGSSSPAPARQGLRKSPDGDP